VQIHVKVEIWSDVVCPWCFIGKRRFEQAVAAFPHPVEVVYSEVCAPRAATERGPPFGWMNPRPAGATHQAHPSHDAGTPGTS